MSGSILGKDQVARINAAYPSLVAHIKALISGDSTPYGQMKVHVACDSLDTTELHAIFAPLAFLSPVEKRALVRAAVFEVLSIAFECLPKTAPVAAVVEKEVTKSESAVRVKYDPPQFSLNPATTTNSGHAGKVSHDIVEG